MSERHIFQSIEEPEEWHLRQRRYGDACEREGEWHDGPRDFLQIKYTLGADAHSSVSKQKPVRDGWTHVSGAARSDDCYVAMRDEDWRKGGLECCQMRGLANGVEVKGGDEEADQCLVRRVVDGRLMISLLRSLILSANRSFGSAPLLNFEGNNSLTLGLTSREAPRIEKPDCLYTRLAQIHDARSIETTALCCVWEDWSSSTGPLLARAAGMRSLLRGAGEVLLRRAERHYGRVVCLSPFQRTNRLPAVFSDGRLCVEYACDRLRRRSSVLVTPPLHRQATSFVCARSLLVGEGGLTDVEFDERIILASKLSDIVGGEVVETANVKLGRGKFVEVVGRGSCGDVLSIDVGGAGFLDKFSVCCARSRSNVVFRHCVSRLVNRPVTQTQGTNIGVLDGMSCSQTDKLQPPFARCAVLRIFNPLCSIPLWFVKLAFTSPA
ncbi:hypothetical protein KCU93_g397, partial [Aureobasidium melanogenum]